MMLRYGVSSTPTLVLIDRQGIVRMYRPTRVTLAVLSAMFGRLLAWMIAEPAAMAVTGTVTTLEPGEKLTVAGTVTALMLLEVRLTITPPAGAPADSVSVRFCVPVPVMVRLSGLKTTVAITCTAELAGSGRS